jgi:hypothetical protein
MRLSTLIVLTLATATLVPEAAEAQQPLCAIDPASAIVLPAETHRDRRTGEVVVDSPAKRAYRLADGSVLLLGRMTIDADGHPNAYAPNNAGLDNTSSGGGPGRWYAIATRERNCPENGTPFVHMIGNPPRPYYVSKTTLTNPTVTGPNKCRTQANYVHSGEIPYVALSPLIATIDHRASTGRLAAVFDTRPASRRLAFAVHADQAPKSGFGEGSIALAEKLGLPSNPRAGGIGQRALLYVVFPDRLGFPANARAVEDAAGTAFARWGGMPRLQACEAALRGLPQ